MIIYVVLETYLMSKLTKPDVTQKTLRARFSGMAGRQGDEFQVVLLVS